MTHADLHQTHHRDTRQSRHDLFGPKYWRSPMTNNPLQPQPNHDQRPKHKPNHDPQPTSAIPTSSFKHRSQPKKKKKK